MGEADRTEPGTRAYRSGYPLVFNHIPRTAGGSLSEALIALVEPEIAFVGFDRGVLGPDLDFDSLHPKFRPLLAASPSELPGDAAFVSGHITPGTTMARYGQADHVTVLREPRVRVLSLWLWNRWHSEFRIRRLGGLAESMRACRAPLVDYLGNALVAGHTDNSVTRFLVWPHPLVPDADFIDPSADDDLFAAALERLDRYAFVGLVEEPALVARLGEWLGGTLVMPQAGELSPLPRRVRPDVASELAAASDILRTRCRIDDRVWRHFVRKILPAEDPADLGDRVFEDAVRRYSDGQIFVKVPRRSRLEIAVEQAFDRAVRVMQRPASAERRTNS